MPEREARERRRRALLIATSTYSDPGLAGLRAPAGDVRSLAEVLGDDRIGRFDVTEIVDRPAEYVEQEIEGFFDEARPDELLLLYLSGHGVLSQDRQLYFAMSNTTLRRLRSTAVEDDFIRKVIQHSRARSVVLVLDCCHSGAYARGHTPKSATGVDVGHRFEGGRGRVWLTASTELEYAFEQEDGESDVSAVGAMTSGSVFTRALVEGLRTGDADGDEDGIVSVDELYDYVCARVRERAPNQTPSMGGDKRGDIPIAHSGRAATLPREFVQAIESPLTSVRGVAVGDLDVLLNTAPVPLAAAIVRALEKLAADDSQKVSAAAEAVLVRRGLWHARPASVQAVADPPVHEAPPTPPRDELPPAPPAPPPPAVVEEPRRRRLPGRRALAGVAAVGATAAAAAVIALALGDGDGPRPEAAQAYDFTGGGRQQLVASVPHEAGGRAVVIHGDPADPELARVVTAEEAGVDESPSDFGSAITSADFDLDGRADLALGTGSANLVSLYHVEEGGEWVERFAEDDEGLPEGAGDYGTSLLAADLNADGFRELVAGAPGSTSDTGSGAIRILFGGPDGLSRSGARWLLPPEEVSQFGRRFRAGDIDGDDVVDLVAGAPDGQLDGHTSWCRGGSRGPTSCELLDHNGASSLATADLDGDGFDEIIVGDARVTAEDETEQEQGTAGELRIWRGGAEGPAAEPQTITEESLGLETALGDKFGSGVDAGDADGDGDAEIVVGAPGRDRAFLLTWSPSDVTAEPILPPGDVPTFGTNVALLDLTGATGLDLVVTAPKAEAPEQRIMIVPGGATAPEPLAAGSAREDRPGAMTLGRRPGA